MADYNYAADQIKEGIIDLYLQENPSVKRHEVVTKTVNGRVVVSTINDIMNTMGARNKLPNPQDAKNQKLLKQLAKGGDERYGECLTSIQHSNQYIDWLTISKSTGFSAQDKKEQSEFLKRHESVCSSRALDLLESKKKFVETLKGKIKPSKSAINTLLMEYMQAVFEQLKAQKAIYKKEVDLGNQFSSSIQQFFTTQFSGLRSRPDPAAVRAIARAVTLLRNNQVAVPETDIQKDPKVLSNSLSELGDKLKKRRQEFQELQKLIDFLEAAIAELKQNAASPPKDKGADSFRRMAFTTKRK